MTGREPTFFLQAAGWGGASRTLVAGDASNRRYKRLTQMGQTAILMDAPPDKGEDTEPFVRIATHLAQIGLSAPQILAQDRDAGFLLIEDLGDDLFARLLETSTALEPTLYSAAVDVLVHTHAAPPPLLPKYDGAVMTDLAVLAFDWYQRHGVGEVTGKETAHDALLAVLDPLPCTVLIQRDYHAENLIWLPQRHGASRVGLLDFQDAMLGHPAYDLCSVLLDARRDVSPSVQSSMLDRYKAQACITDDVAFDNAYWALALQRNRRILGVFARLCVRDGKMHYVDLMPRVWSYITRALSHPSLEHLAPILLNTLPAPELVIRDRLKAQCPTP